MTLRALIVDDEPLARDRLRQLAAEVSDLAIVGECGSGLDALAAIADTQPDVLFLDVQMPGLDGFGVVEALAPDTRPLVIFTTAFDAHAVKAFDARALDYLVKPFRRERFEAAIARAREQVSKRRAAHVVTRLTIRGDDTVAVVPVATIEVIEAAGNYVSVHTATASHILRDTLTALEAKLDPAYFLRVSRGAIVNLQHVSELRSAVRDGLVAVLRSGRRIPMTRGLREVEHALRYRSR